MFTKLDSQSLCIYLELLSMKGIVKSIILHVACTGVYRVSVLAIFVVMKHSTIFTGIGDVDTRSFHRHSRDTGFPCLLGYSKQERPLVVDHYFYKHFTYRFKSTIDKQDSSL